MTAALSVRPYRVLWLCTLGSQVGNWMQNVILAAFVWTSTGSPVLTALVGFCNLVPQMILPTIGGTLADSLDRRRLLATLTTVQLVASLGLAWVARTPDFSRVPLFVLVMVIGAASALEAPLLLAVTPSLVPATALPGAIALGTVSLNASRVVGPVIGTGLYVWAGPSWVFLGNTTTYLFMLFAVGRVAIPSPRATGGESYRSRVAEGYRFVRADPVAWRAIVTIALFAAAGSVFVPLLPVVASQDWGISSKSVVYGLAYATFGTGAVCGSLSVGTVLTRFPMSRVLRLGLLGFAACLAAYISIDGPALAFPIGFALGFCHYALVTSCSTMFQGRVTNDMRGRVSGLWLMAFIGPVPLSTLLAGWLTHHSTVNTVLYTTCGLVALIAWYARPVNPAPPATTRTSSPRIHPAESFRSLNHD